jgi:hypothetical protein
VTNSFTKITELYSRLFSLDRSWGSSVNIVSYYRVDYWGSIPSRGKRIFPLACVQTSSEGHPASYPVGTRVHFSAKVKNEQEQYHKERRLKNEPYYPLDRRLGRPQCWSG